MEKHGNLIQNGIITVNALSARQAFKFFQLREKHRHEQDIENINADLEKLKDVEIPEEVLGQIDCWYEI